MQTVFIEVVLTGYFNQKVRLYKGHLKGDIPVTYKRLGVCGHSIGNNYNPSILTVFKAKDGSLRYEIYRDGCFCPYYGRIELL